MPSPKAQTIELPQSDYWMRPHPERSGAYEIGRKHQPEVVREINGQPGEKIFTMLQKELEAAPKGLFWLSRNARQAREWRNKIICHYPVLWLRGQMSDEEFWNPPEGRSLDETDDIARIWCLDKRTGLMNVADEPCPDPRSLQIVHGSHSLHSALILGRDETDPKDWIVFEKQDKELPFALSKLSSVLKRYGNAYGCVYYGDDTSQGYTQITS